MTKTNSTKNSTTSRVRKNGMIRRIMMAILTVIVMLVSRPVDALAAGTWDDGIKNGKIWCVGRVVVCEWSPTKGVTAKRFGANLYGAEASYLQSVTDRENAMEYDVVDGWARTIGDHVRSCYSGKCENGCSAFGIYELWNCKTGDLLQVEYTVTDGYILKNWFLESVDRDAYYKKGVVYFADGTNMDTYGLDKANKDNVMLMTHCWPNAWGTYPKAGCDGRVIGVFRENHQLKWDVYVKDDGSVLYGDYDIYTNTFVWVKKR